MQILIERLVLLGAVLASIFILGIGAYLARHLGDPHWMNRAGAAVVVAQAICGMAEFSRRRRLGRLRLSVKPGRKVDSPINRAKRVALDERSKEFLDEEIEKSELNATVIVLCLAAIGELFHGFGDLVFKLLS